MHDYLIHSKDNFFHILGLKILSTITNARSIQPAMEQMDKGEIAKLYNNI